MVIFVLAVTDHDPSMEQRVKAVDIQTLITDPGIEGLNIPVSPGLTRRNVGEPGSGARPVGEGIGDELGPVVTAQHHRCPMLSDEFLEMFDEPVSGDRSFYQTAQVFPCVLVYDRADLDPSGAVDLRRFRGVVFWEE